MEQSLFDAINQVESPILSFVEGSTQEGEKSANPKVESPTDPTEADLILSVARHMLSVTSSDKSAISHVKSTIPTSEATSMSARSRPLLRGQFLALRQREIVD